MGGLIPPLIRRKKEVDIESENGLFVMDNDDVLYELQEIVYSEDSSNDDKLRALRMIGTCLGMFSMDMSITRS